MQAAVNEPLPDWSEKFTAAGPLCGLVMPKVVNNAHPLYTGHPVTDPPGAKRKMVYSDAFKSEIAREWT